MKKTITILLCAALALCLFAGCGKDGGAADVSGSLQSPSEAPSVSPSDGGEEGDDGEASPSSPSASPDGGGSSPRPSPDENAYAADTLMLTVDGEAVTWSQLYPWLLYSIASFESNYGEIADFSAEITAGVTYADYIAGNAAGALRYYRSIEKNAAAQGIELSEADMADIERSVSDSRASFESEAAYMEYVSSSYGSAEQYEYMLRVSKLYTKCFEEQYGVNGDKLAERDILDYVADDGYMMAKHILLKTVDDSGAPLSDEEKAEKYARMERLLAELDACADTAAMEAKFDELMQANSEDPGSASFPGGYLFRPGQMVTEFESAVQALAEHEHSGIVESTYGYHIILRLPIDVSAVPTEYSAYLSYGVSYTLRGVAAEGMFSDVVSGWAENLTVEPAEAYDSLDLTKLFG